MTKKIAIVVLTLGILVVFTDQSDGCIHPPIAYVSPQTQYVAVNSEFTLNGSGTPGNPDVQIVSYEWDLNYDGITFVPDPDPKYNGNQTITVDTGTATGKRIVAFRVKDNHVPGLYSSIKTAAVYVCSGSSVPVLYVKQGGTGYGTSWSDATGNLQAALYCAAYLTSNGAQIWVAQGTYKPAPYPIYRNLSFVLNTNVSMYGGFTGIENFLDERDWITNETILSGDIDNDGLDAGNSLHVVKGANDAILDGFTISGGYANGTGDDARGGGMLNVSVSPIVRNCRFTDNFATDGTVLYNKSSTMQIINCYFYNNGGGIYNSSSNISIVSCTFNEPDYTVIYNNASNPGIVSSIVWGSETDSIVNASGSTPYISYSDVRGCKDDGTWVSAFGHDGGNNINVPPQFNTNLEPQAAQCIGTGVDSQNMGVNPPKDSTALNTVTTGLTYPVDLVVNSAGNVYVLDSTSSPSHVFIYNNTLTQQGDPIPIDAANPMGIALDTSGRIYIADTGGNRILRYIYDTENGWILDTYYFGNSGVVGSYGSDEGYFDGPWGIAVDGSGYIYVTDKGNDRIQVFDSYGNFARKFGQSGSGNGQLAGPSGLYLLGASKVFVAEAANHRIQNLSTNGYFLSKIGSQGSGTGQFNTPQDICYDLNYDQIIVADTANNRLQIFQLHNYDGTGISDPTFVRKITNQNLSSPMGVACAADKTTQIIYIADTGNGRIVRLKIEQNQPSKTPLQVWESMKGALFMGDKNKALSFFADISKGQYSQIFDLIGTHLQDYVNDMGQMTLSYQTSTEAKYEMSYQDGSQIYSFPVFFTKDLNGEWRVSQF